MSSNCYQKRVKRMLSTLSALEPVQQVRKGILPHFGTRRLQEEADDIKKRFLETNDKIWDKQAQTFENFDYGFHKSDWMRLESYQGAGNKYFKIKKTEISCKKGKKPWNNYSHFSFFDDAKDLDDLIGWEMNRGWMNMLVAHTVVILINATTLMHKSTLSSNNFGNDHFGQKYQKQNILRIFRRL